VPPTTSFTLLRELIHLDALHLALSNRDDTLLEPVLRLLVKYVTDPRFGTVCCDVGRVVISCVLLFLSQAIPPRADHIFSGNTDLYSGILGQSPLVDQLFVRLRKKIDGELKMQRELIGVLGAVEMVLNANSLNGVGGRGS
jgi:U3 small nucleolar RNA-associated protein 15